MIITLEANNIADKGYTHYKNKMARKDQLKQYNDDLVELITLDVEGSDVYIGRIDSYDNNFLTLKPFSRKTGVGQSTDTLTHSCLSDERDKKSESITLATRIVAQIKRIPKEVVDKESSLVYRVYK